MVVEIEKEKEERQGHWTLAQEASDPAWPSPTANPRARAERKKHRTMP